MFSRGETVAIGASGGKDSTVLAHVMTTLNKRYDYGLNLLLLSVDEGIAGYRDDSLETVKRNQQQYQIPLRIVSYKELYGWSMDEIVRRIGTKNNCTFCGVFRRQALDRGAQLSGATKLLTGHNCDDIAETVLMNVLRGDIARLGRCVDIVTGRNGVLPRGKPFKFAYEKEIVMYAYFLRLDYFSTECKYSPFAYRGFAREFMKDLERSRPRALLDIITSAEYFAAAAAVNTTSRGNTNKNTDVATGALTKAGVCTRCGYMSSQKICKACVLLESLEAGDLSIATKGTSRGGVASAQAAKKKKQSIEEEDTRENDVGFEAAQKAQLEARTLAEQQRVPKKLREALLVADTPETMARLLELGLRVKENETLAQALRRIKKQEGFLTKQLSRGTSKSASASTSLQNDGTTVPETRGVIEVEADEE